MKDVLKYIWIKMLLKIIFIELLFLITFRLLIGLEIVEVNVDSVINAVITTLGLIIAIITTFIFSKIFSERTERINRKRTIDSYSKRLTALRRLAYKLTRHNEFWLGNNPNIIKDNYPGLNVFQFRNLKYDVYNSVLETTKLSELTVQAYLSAKWLEGPDAGMYEMIDPTYKKNYSLEEIESHREAAILIYSYLNHYQEDIHFLHLHEHWLNGIKEELKKSNGQEIELNIKSIYLTFDNAYSDFLVKMYELTQKNIRSLGSAFEGLFMDLFMGSILILFSVFMTTFMLSSHTKYTFISVLLSGLLCVVVDIFINTIILTRRELNVNEFYE